MNNLACLISTLKCSAKLLNFIECAKWFIIIVTVAVSGIFALKTIRENKELLPKLKRLIRKI